MVAAVARNVSSLLGPRVQQPLALGILALRAHKIAVANAVDGFLPGLSKVARPKNVRPQIVETVSIDCRICGTGIEMRRFHEADRAPLRYARGRDVLPRHSAVLRQLDVPIIRSNPYQTFLDLRRRDRHDGAKHLFRRGVYASDGELQPASLFLHPPFSKGIASRDTADVDLAAKKAVESSS